MPLVSTRTIEALVDAAVAQALSVPEDDDTYWNVVYAIQESSLRAAWPLVAPLAGDAKAPLRELAADVLRCASSREPSLVGPVAELLASRLAVESEPVVIQAILFALGELSQPDRTELALPFATHSDARVRRGVVSALSGARAREVIRAFIRLSADENENVRDWATFELGSLLGDDAEPARDDIAGVVEALLVRVEDEHLETRSEAIVGLARRRDRRALPALLAVIEKHGLGPQELEAATALGATELCEPLRTMLAEGDDEDVAYWEEHGIRQAIAACCASPDAVEGTGPAESSPPRGDS